jgi:hypothetical protein
LLFAAALCAGGTISQTGTFLTPEDTVVIPITLMNLGNVTLQTYGFGGGVNAAATAIAPGGFDPFAGLFQGTGATALFLDGTADNLSNYTAEPSACPPAGLVTIGSVTGQCGDVRLIFTGLAAGTYTVLLSEASYVPNAVYGTTGDLGDGFSDLTGGALPFQTCYDETDCNTDTANWALDITTSSAASVPEPRSLALVGIGLALAVCVTQIAHNSRSLWGRMASCRLLETGAFLWGQALATVAIRGAAYQAAPRGPNYTGQDFRRRPLAFGLAIKTAIRRPMMFQPPKFILSIRTGALAIGALILASPAMSAGPITFAVSGSLVDGATLSGDLVIDTSTAVVDSANFTVTGPLSFTVNTISTIDGGQFGPVFQLYVDNGVTFAPVVILDLPTTSLAGYTAGGLCISSSPSCPSFSEVYGPLPAEVQSDFTSASLAAVPEPAPEALVGSAMLGLWALRRRFAQENK